MNFHLFLSLLLILPLLGCQSLELTPERRVERFWQAYGTVACYGIEPFWDVDVQKNQVLYSEPGREKYDIVWGKPFLSFFEGQYSITAQDGPQDMRLMMAPKNCQSDSKKNHPLTATFYLGGRELKGCCYSTRDDSHPFLMTNPDKKVSPDPELIEGLERLEEENSK